MPRADAASGGARSGRDPTSSREPVIQTVTHLGRRHRRHPRAASSSANGIPSRRPQISTTASTIIERREVRRDGAGGVR